ncbi:MAG: hypothetical protein ACK43K_14390, partial [Chitinophagales bacterium]
MEKASKTIQIGILGCGTVGTGLVKLLQDYQADNRNPKVIISQILVKNQSRAQEISDKLGLDIKIFTTN